MEKKINERLDTMLSEFKGMVDFGVKDIKLVFVEILSLVMAHISSTLMLLGFGLIFLLFLSLLYLNFVHNYSSECAKLSHKDIYSGLQMVDIIVAMVTT